MVTISNILKVGFAHHFSLFEISRTLNPDICENILQNIDLEIKKSAYMFLCDS
jgi:hypothetical protein